MKEQLASLPRIDQGQVIEEIQSLSPVIQKKWLGIPISSEEELRVQAALERSQSAHLDPRIALAAAVGIPVESENRN